ncbi:MAG: hypothetical protein K9M75_01035 [Phycisphaerae bacterium]|nr:hypothetical protein [Phycisphaerae bacterium]
MKRREFVKLVGASGIFPFTGNCLSGSVEVSHKSATSELMEKLLKQWCDGMLKMQIYRPDDPALNGALGCPSCSFIHGRCMDAVYPFLYMANRTGEKKYLDAGIRAFEWSKNVSQPDGSWTVIADPKSWKGITVFGAIALADALKYHGSVLDKARRERWLARLRQAGDFLLNFFTKIDSSNLNYGCTTVYAMHLLGTFLDEPKYIRHSQKLAGQFEKYLTKPNQLIFGEGKPVDGKSPRGLLPVDLGYNVEESLNGIAMYALAAGDQKMIDLVAKSMTSHLEFMLPDGGWDNSWGTRQFKWTYWGSRTSDGCQPGYALMRHKNPAFTTAVYQNTRLMEQCTHNGLLYGGPHYVSHGVKPCIHHTFTHAKALACVLDHEGQGFKIDHSPVLPRMKASGVKEFPELATFLASIGPWRATVTAYDRMYQKNMFHPTGGAMSVLWHKKLGNVLSSSMAKYILKEKNNMQPDPNNRDDPLTLRVEAFKDGVWYTNLFDKKAEVSYTDNHKEILFKVKTRLVSEEGKLPVDGQMDCVLIYRLNLNVVNVKLETTSPVPEKMKISLVVPIISPSGEKVDRVSENRIEIQKPDGKVAVQSNCPLRIQDTGRDRIFNMVPGFEAVSIAIDVKLVNGSGTAEFNIIIV